MVLKDSEERRTEDGGMVPAEERLQGPRPPYSLTAYSPKAFFIRAIRDIRGYRNSFLAGSSGLP